MTLRTSLIIDGDGSGADRMLKGVEQGMDSAERGAKSLGVAATGAAAAIDSADAAIADLARSSQTAAGGLNSLDASAASVGARASQMAAQAQASAAAAVGMARGVTGAGAASGLAGHHVQNLAFQAQDLGIQLVAAAQSSAPLQMSLMALMQQGSQIYGIMMQAGVGVGGLVSELARMIGIIKVSSDAVLDAAAKEAGAHRAAILAMAERSTSAIAVARADAALAASAIEVATTADAAAAAQVRLAAANEAEAAAAAEAAIANAALGKADADAAETGAAAMAKRTTSLGRFGVVGIAIGAVLGVLTAGFQLFQSQVDKSDVLDKYVASLGLTKDEMKEMTDITVTVGDVFAGLWKTIDEGLGVSKVMAAIKGWAVEAFTTALGWGKNAAAGIYAAWVGSFNALGVVWRRFPQTMSEAAGLAANLAISAVEKMVNFGVTGLNKLIMMANSAGAALGLSFKIPTLQAIEFGRVVVANAGAGRAALAEIGAGYTEAFNDAMAGMDRLGARLKSNILDAAKDRLKEQADKIKEKRKDPSAKKEKEEVDKLMESIRKLEIANRNAIAAANEASIKRNSDWISEQVKIDDAARKAKQSLDDMAMATINEKAIERSRQFLENLRSIADAANDAADTMSSAFGRVGGAIGDSLAILAEYGETQGRIAEDVKAGNVSAAEGQKQLTNAQLKGMGQLLGTAKGLFKEHSAGYKAMAAAEKAFAVVQLANTAINIAAGAAKMFATLGPFGFPAVAAMVAVMAGLGAAVSGGGNSYRPPTAKEVQAQQGTGSVLGDASAKTDSINNSLALMLKNTNKDLEYSSQMVRSLRAIETNIGALSASVAARLGVNGGFDNSGLGLGSTMGKSAISSAIMAIPGMALLGEIPVIGGLVSGIVKALFGTKKTISVLDQGIVFAAQSVEEIINGGAIGQIYQDIQTQTKKKFLGLTYSNKTKVTTNYGDLDNDMERQVALIIGSMRAGIIDAAGVLGVDGAQAALDAFEVNLGKISLKDLKGDEIQEQLEAVFAKLGDDMAAAALPVLAEFQKVGEGQFETLMRLAKDYATVDTGLRSIGMAFGAVGMASIAAREDLIDLFGGLEGFMSQTEFFRENFLTEAEQMAPIIQAVGAEMARLGVSSVTTNDQFKALVLAQDLSTAAGRELYASLLAVAPAFAKVNEYAASIANNTRDLKLERQLEIEQLKALGRLEEAEQLERQDALAAIPEYLRAKKLETWAILDAAKVADEAAAAARARAEADAEAARKAADIAHTAREQTIRILELEGNAAAAKAMKEADFLAALDPSLHAQQRRIWALEAEQEAVEGTTAAMQDAARQMLLAGDSLGYVAEMGRRARDAVAGGGSSGDSRVDAAIRALNQAAGDPEQYQIQFQRLEAILGQNARRELSVNALLVQNVGEALDAVRNLAARPNTDLGWSIIQGIRDGFADLTGGQALDRSFATVMGRQRGNRLFGDADAPGIAGVRSASDQLDFVSARGYSNQRLNDIIDALGGAAEGLLDKTEGTFRMLGKDVEAMTDMLAGLSGEMFEGSISAEAARAQVAALVEMFPQLTTVAQSMEAQIERATAAAETLTRTGLRSINFYFGNLSDMADDLARNGSTASETLDTLSGAIGRMNSFATVFEESVAAVERGVSATSRLGGDRTLNPRELRNVAAAEAIAAAARDAASFLITEQGKAISEALADDAAFAGVSPELRKTAALLLEGIGAYDIPSFEAAFIRMSDALADGTITVDQFNALFAYSKDIVTDAAKAAEDAAQIAADAAAKAAEIAQQSREMDIRIAELTLGDRAAELMRREDLFKTLDPTLHAKQRYIWALEDERAISAAAADAANKLADAARNIIGELDQIIGVLDGGLKSLIGNSEALRAAQDASAMLYLRSISGAPDLNDEFRDAVGTISSLTSDGFSSQVDFLRELGQRSSLLATLRDQTEVARRAAEWAEEQARSKAEEEARKDRERQTEIQTAQLEQATSTNERLTALMAELEKLAPLMAATAEATTGLLDNDEQRLSEQVYGGGS